MLKSFRSRLFASTIPFLVASFVLAGSAATEPKAAPSKTFVYAVPALPTHLGVWPSEGDATQVLYAALDSKLVDYNLNKLAKNGCAQVPSSTDVIGNLAQSWTIKKDKYIEFKLKNIKSSFGNPLTAEDVRWSVWRATNRTDSQTIPSAFRDTARFNLDNLMTVVDKHTIRFNLVRSTALDIQTFTNVLIPIWDATEAKKHVTPSDPQADAWFQNNTGDFGPWKVDSFTPGQEVVLTPNPYWKGSRGNVGRVVIRAVPDATVRAQLLRSGDVQFASRLTSDQYQGLQGAAGVNVLTCASAVRDWLGLNEKYGPLADVRVRQAISYAIDRRALVNVAYRGVLGRPARFGLSQFVKFPQPPVSQQYKFDLDKAKSLLAAAGYANGFNMTITYSESRPGPQATPTAVLLKTMLGRVGINVDLRFVAGNTDFFTLYRNGNFQAVIYSENAVIADPVFNASSFTRTGATSNPFGYSSPTWDALLDKATFATPGSAVEAAALREIARLAVTDMPIVYLVDTIANVALRSNVTAYRHDILGQMIPHYLVLK